MCVNFVQIIVVDSRCVRLTGVIRSHELEVVPRVASCLAFRCPSFLFLDARSPIFGTFCPG